MLISACGHDVLKYILQQQHISAHATGIDIAIIPGVPFRDVDPPLNEDKSVFDNDPMFVVLGAGNSF